MKTMFIKHIESHSQIALDGELKYAAQGQTSCGMQFDFELSSKSNLIHFKGTFISETDELTIDKNFGFIYNSPGCGEMIWKYIINFLWHTFSHSEKIYDEFMKVYFNCDIDDLYNGNF